MKKLLISLILIIQPLTVLAGQALTKENVEAFYSVADKWESIESKYPDIVKKSDEFDPTQQKELISYIKSSKANSEIQSILKANGFKSMEEYFDLSLRMMGAMFSVQMESMPAGMDMASAEKMLVANIDNMKKQGLPPEAIVGMERQLAQMKKQMKLMELASKHVTEADKKFVKDNMAWLMSKIPNEGMSP